MNSMSNPNPGTMTVRAQVKTLYSILMFLGLAGFVLSLFNDVARAWHAYLIGFYFFTCLGLGGLVFVALQHMTKAGWSVNVRRFAESFSAFLPFSAVAGIVLVIFGSSHLYEWLNPHAVAEDPLLQHKAPYLNGPFYWIRTVVFFAIWLIFARVLVGKSLAQDESGDVKLTESSVGPSVAFILLFALSFSFFSVDHLMSLEPHWFSTIFGVYCFAGLFQSTMAALILLVVYFMKNGQVKGFVNENHLHDLGKFLFAFTIFWAYIAFSQYMLIWYANLPEETIFFIPRSQGEWVIVSLALILFKFVVPFLALLPRWAKRSPNHLVAVSILVLVMQFVDLYWLVYPEFNAKKALFSYSEVLVFLGFLGLFLFSVTRFLSRHSIVPIKDPRIHESLDHHVVY